MKTISKVAGALLVVLLLAVAGGYARASNVARRTLARTFDTHAVDFPVPFPSIEAEAAEPGPIHEQSHRLALEQAVERGRHLVEARYACTGCHGADLGGGVMVDTPPIGRLLGSNLTGGAGSRTVDYAPADWDRIVRHGVLPDGRPSLMPAEDFRLMSDQELSDIVAFVSALPPVDNRVAPPTLGPLGKVLLATGRLRLSADLIGAHDTPHRAYPPAAEATVEFGRHLAATCTGCHGHDLAGGPIAGGDPSWVPARNLTPHESGLGSWSYQDFDAAMRRGVRPDGTDVEPPMTMLTPYARKMTDVEMEAMWVYLRSLPPMPTGG